MFLALLLNTNDQENNPCWNLKIKNDGRCDQAGQYSKANIFNHNRDAIDGDICDKIAIAHHEIMSRIAHS